MSTNLNRRALELLHNWAYNYYYNFGIDLPQFPDQSSSFLHLLPYFRRAYSLLTTFLKNGAWEINFFLVNRLKISFFYSHISLIIWAQTYTGNHVQCDCWEISFWFLILCINCSLTEAYKIHNDLKIHNNLSQFGSIVTHHDGCSMGPFKMELDCSIVPRNSLNYFTGDFFPSSFSVFSFWNICYSGHSPNFYLFFLILHGFIVVVVVLLSDQFPQLLIHHFINVMTTLTFQKLSCFILCLHYLSLPKCFYAFLLCSPTSIWVAFPKTFIVRNEIRRPIRSSVYMVVIANNEIHRGMM